MNPEELLKPRYKVIADYPNSPYRIRDTLTLAASPTDLWDCSRTGSRKLIAPTEYPAIFRKLEWWEERSIEDMPQYLKRIDSKCSLTLPGGIVVKVGDIIPMRTEEYILKHFIPATEQEYNDYIKSQP